MMFIKITTLFFIIFAIQVIRCDPPPPPPDYDDDDCGCPCDPNDDDDPCWNNCDDDGCGALLANLGLGNTLGNAGGTLDNTLGGLGRKKRQSDVSLDDVVAVADILSRKKREMNQRTPGGFEPNM